MMQPFVDTYGKIPTGLSRVLIFDGPWKMRQASTLAGCSINGSMAKARPKLSTSHKWSEGSLTVSVKQTKQNGFFTVQSTVEIGQNLGQSTEKCGLMAQPPHWV